MVQMDNALTAKNEEQDTTLIRYGHRCRDCGSTANVQFYRSPFADQHLMILCAQHRADREFAKTPRGRQKRRENNFRLTT